MRLTLGSRAIETSPLRASPRIVVTSNLQLICLRTAAYRLGFDSLLAMNNTGKIECIFVGVFDEAQSLDRAAERLAAEGFEYSLLDEATAREEPCNVDPVPVGPVLAVGPVPAQGSDLVASDLSSIGRAVRSQLVGYNLPDEVIGTYTTTLYRKGKLVIVRTEPELAEQITDLLRKCGASRVDRHD
jgi:hypothetical protein